MCDKYDDVGTSTFILNGSKAKLLGLGKLK